MKKFVLIASLLLSFCLSFANRINISKGSDNGAFITNYAATGADTLVIRASLNPWSYIYVGSCHGLNANVPLVILNEGNVSMSNGVTIENSYYIHLTGTGTRTTFYGFTVTQTGYGTTASNSIGVKGLSHDVEVDYVDVTGSGYVLWAKNELSEYQSSPDKGQPYWWPARMYNLEFHHLRGRYIYQDGMYIGSSDPLSNSRSVGLDNSTSSVTIPTTHPSTVTFTVPTSKVYYVVGTRVVIVSNTGASISGTIFSYNSGTGALQISTTANSGTGTYSNWTINAYPRPTGLAGVSIHDCYEYFVGRSGIQWGNVDSTTAKFPVNLIYNDTLVMCGTELNDQQGCGIAFGTASGEAEVYGIRTDSTFKNGFFSYNFSQIYVHDNRFDNVGHLSIDTNTRTVNLPWLIRLNRSIAGVTYSNSVKPQDIVVKPTADYYFIKFPSDGSDLQPTWRAYWTGLNTTGLSARETFIQYFTTAIGSHNGSLGDPYVGWGGSGAIGNNAVTQPTDGRLPYVMTPVTLNAFDNNIAYYGPTRGKTSIVLQRDTANGSTDLTTFFSVGATHNTYDSTKSYICADIFNSAPVTSSQIFIDPGATTFAYRTDCSTLVWPPNGAADPPTANAGSDQSISISTGTLSGTGTPASGQSITIYAWSQISGPNTATIASASSASTGISGLITGTYVFQLDVTQTDTQSASDQVTITVNIPTGSAPGLQINRGKRTIIRQF